MIIKIRFLKSLKAAIKGIIHCINNERNMRIHTVATLYVLLFSTFFDLSFEGYAILIITICCVLTAEMFNTAIEQLSDLSSSNYNLMVRVAKDVAAGAVLIVAIFAIVVGVILFNDLKVYVYIYNYFVNNVAMLVLLILSLIASLIYIKLGPFGIKNRLKMFKIKKKE